MKFRQINILGNFWVKFSEESRIVPTYEHSRYLVGVASEMHLLPPPSQLAPPPPSRPASFPTSVQSPTTLPPCTLHSNTGTVALYAGTVDFYAFTVELNAFTVTLFTGTVAL
ncbi:hypothetical protein F2Q70_00010080 [Brassica cretica]|uniref:Uncharacterized protein n=1 Tax=Brassica cretica TaxID=69181 RepID=A0A8S9M7B5_BRACR|nr:hypothetical protein F2Q70_00010080 [Brassica cretica]KAF3567678.1 hypothetical protein DY000_02013764 [Brassica cretica]